MGGAHWSKKGSMRMTSSPGSMKAMNALSMPSFAPVVITTSVSGFTGLSMMGLYASAMAFLSLGRPYNLFLSLNRPPIVFPLRTLVGAYWLQSTRSRASFAAFLTKSGGL